MVPLGTTGGQGGAGGRDMHYELHFQTVEGYNFNKHKLTGSGREMTMAHLKKCAWWLHHVPCFLYRLLTRNSSFNCDCLKLNLFKSVSAAVYHN